mmetsp:Transcript_54178/g.167717  ORF Transcript_54178/g.167717 Transcript_54178/m.167717 type:complete len:250 (+) Transcript_54178:211-960(+)
MPHCRSLPVRQARHLRARRLAFLRPLPEGRVHLAVPDHLVPRVRAQARNLENHDLCNKVIGRQRQFTAHAILHAKPSLPDETFRQFREDNRRAARARNAWADEPLGDPDFPALPGPVARPCADAATQTNPFDTDPVASEWPSPPTSGLGNPPPGALTAYVTHDAQEQSLDRFPTFDDLKLCCCRSRPWCRRRSRPPSRPASGPSSTAGWTSRRRPSRWRAPASLSATGSRTSKNGSPRRSLNGPRLHQA